MANDEILTEYIESLKAQNKVLMDQLKRQSKSRSILGISEMWDSFWNTIGDMWKSFWSSVSSMWNSVWQSDSSIFGFCLTSIVLGIAIAISSSCIIDSVYEYENPKAVGVATGNYYIRANTNNGCYFVYQELSNGNYEYVTPCIKERADALKALESIKGAKTTK